MASTTLDSVDWQNSHLLEGDVPTAIRELKKLDGPELQVHGSAGLIQTLLREDLVDEFGIWIYPVVIGSGKRLFGDGDRPGRTGAKGHQALNHRRDHHDLRARG